VGLARLWLGQPHLFPGLTSERLTADQTSLIILPGTVFKFPISTDS
jgi:hypothetical protein